MFPSLQIMVKGKGIFVNPASAAAPAKLRVLYEVGPIAYLIEKAGGKSSDGENSALDIQIPNTEVRREALFGHIMVSWDQTLQVYKLRLLRRTALFGDLDRLKNSQLSRERNTALCYDDAWKSNT